MGRSWCSSQLVEFHICGWKPGMLWCKSWRSESCREVYLGWVRIEDQRLVLVKGLLLCCKGHSLQLQHQIVFGWRNDKREEMHALVHLALKWAVPCLFFVKMTMVVWRKSFHPLTQTLPQPQQSLLSCSNSCPVKKNKKCVSIPNFISCSAKLHLDWRTWSAVRCTPRAPPPCQ